jgi:hypothetical protein
MQRRHALLRLAPQALTHGAHLAASVRGVANAPPR